jgi:putative oxidoreductase
MVDTSIDSKPRSSLALSITLWVIQILLALIFLAHGLMMLFPPAELAEIMNEQMGLALRYFIGIAEVAAVAGLIGPSLTRLLPKGTIVTAICLTVLMILAMSTHLVRAEYSSAITCLVIGAMAAFLAYARWKLLPIRGRGQ